MFYCSNKSRHLFNKARQITNGCFHCLRISRNHEFHNLLNQGNKTVSTGKRYVLEPSIHLYFSRHCTIFISYRNVDEWNLNTSLYQLFGKAIKKTPSFKHLQKGVVLWWKFAEYNSTAATRTALIWTFPTAYTLEIITNSTRPSWNSLFPLSHNREFSFMLKVLELQVTVILAAPALVHLHLL